MQQPVDTQQLLSRITTSTQVMLGKPTIRGTRLTVEHVLRALGGGLSYEQLKEDFPFIEPADIQACLLYASQAVENERVYTIGT